MACKTPAIVQRPYHRDPGHLQIIEQHLHVEIKPVDVMQLDHIRLIFIDAAIIRSVTFFGSKSMLALEKKK